MLLNPSKILFFITLMSGTLITISSNSWLGAWMGLEINLLSFIPLMIDMNNLMSTEAALKYFLTQALASSILLFGIISYMMISNLTYYLNLMDNNISSMMINSTLLLKSGAAPFHFWFPEVMQGITWMNNLILMTIQKIAPLILISYSIQLNFLFIIIVLSILIGSLGGLNQTSLQKVMAFSSINHLGWLLCAMIFSENLWLFYFLMYALLSMSIILLFNNFQIFYINQTFSLFNKNIILKFSLFISLLSLGGLPPFLGFLPKWIIIKFMVLNNYLFLLVFMVTFTLITLFFYLRICYSAFLMNNFENSWMNLSKINILMLIFSFISIFGLFTISILYWIF
uniref:NADH-ubiquinone oxidoreductase chain 2 n=2 Tax=Protoplasa fitchii TaxID=560777 RepID=G8J8C5_9DIPT|nr:NADH dehydrogenase subunit 2 [Protoplasa fitchii]AET13043.1 NADH dehydrogenase subunit 2 [Protoplasa fitchii]